MKRSSKGPGLLLIAAMVMLGAACSPKSDPGPVPQAASHGPAKAKESDQATTPSRASADPAKEDDRIKELEKRVANLEKEVADLRAQLKLPPKPALDNKLIGSWGVVKPTEKGLKAFRLEQDGSCLLVGNRGPKESPEALRGKYQVVGNVISMTVMRVGGESDFVLEVESVTEKELVLGQCSYGNYFEREKDVRLQRQ